MGRIYRAFDPLAKRMVAIKTLRTEYLQAQNAEAYHRRFRLEAQAAGGLSHPGIVRIFDQGAGFIVMELLDGVSLAALLAERGRLSQAEALDLLMPLADALSHVHAKGVVHQDVKPGNVMVLEDRTVRIIDFGLALVAAEGDPPADRFLGTPSYMAPEQILTGRATAQSDLFSLGVVAYEMLTGQRPFSGDSAGTIAYRVVFEDAAPPSRLVPALPRAYDEIFARVLAKEPADRLPNVGAFASALDAHRPAAKPQPRRPPPPRPSAPHVDPRVEAHLEPHAEPEESLDDILERAARTPERGRPGEETQDLHSLTAGLFAMARDGTYIPPLHPLLLERDTLDAVVLEVESDPVEASVWVDGLPMGVTPLLLRTLAPGQHTVRVIRDGFAPVQLVLKLGLSAEVHSLCVTLQPVNSLAARARPTAPDLFAPLDGSEVSSMPAPPRRVKPS